MLVGLTLKQLGHFFQNVILLFNIFTIDIIICMELVQYNGYFFSTVSDTDALVLWNQDISSHSAEYAALGFKLLKD